MTGWKAGEESRGVEVCRRDVAVVVVVFVFVFVVVAVDSMMVFSDTKVLL